MAAQVHSRSAKQAAAHWAELPTDVWEQVAGKLPLPDLLSLRQGWHGATRLGQACMCEAAVAKLRRVLEGRLAIARSIPLSGLTDGMEFLEEAFGELGLVGEDGMAYLGSFMRGAAEAVGYSEQRSNRPIVAGGEPSEGLRVGFASTAPPTEVEAVVAITHTTNPDFEVELEEVRFPALDLVYELAHALDNNRCRVRSMRVGEQRFGRLMPRPMSEAPAYIAALAAEAAALPRLHLPDGRWHDALLLPACHAAMLKLYRMQS